MAFQLRTKESVSDGIARNVKRQIEKALDYLGAHKTSRAAQSEAVHEVRKCFKKARAAVRLVREDLGDDIYHDENCCFRDAARPLTQVRDAEMLIETLDKLEQEPAAPTSFAKIRQALVANQTEVINRVVRQEKAFAAIVDVATGALARLPNWKIERDGWVAMDSGLRRVYRSGHRALTLSTENPSVENLHEWRKQAKYLWHQLQLLEPAWTSSAPDLAAQFHQLSRLLGEDHDLAVLRQTLAADPLAYGGHLSLKELFTFIDPRRDELERQAFALGRTLYKDSPKVFTGRIAACWTAWAKTEGAQPKPARPSVGGSRAVRP